MESLQFELIKEEYPDDTFRNLFERNWPAYRAWYLDEGEAARPTYLECIQALQQYMPEIYPVYQDILKLIDADDLQARFLSMFCPPPFYSGCSQLVIKSQTPVLIRNYDFPPTLCEGGILYSQWLGNDVIAMSDCLVGALDGMNNKGLAVSISYGGQMLQGKGFGVTIVVRYVLETCSNIQEAINAFCRIPIHLDYNITVLDAKGNHATLHIAPDCNVSVTDEIASTNHQEPMQPEEMLFLPDSRIRLESLQHLYTLQSSPEEIVRQFLSPPLYRSHLYNNSGTLYTAAYYPVEGRVEYIWPHTSIQLNFNKLQEISEQNIHIHYDH